MRRSREEMEIEFDEQIVAFRHSIASYDQGNEWEFKRLATSIYIIAFDGTGGRTVSMLTQLGLKSGMRLLSSFVLPKLPPNTEIVGGTLSPLVDINFFGFTYVPVFDRNRADCRRLPFSRWWDEKVFFEHTRIPLSRKNLIFTARTQDGGAHVDERITDQHYRSFKDDGGGDAEFISFTLNDDPEKFTHHKVKGGVIALLRQISWELDQSLREIGR
jgi:hypothetical protein